MIYDDDIDDEHHSGWDKYVWGIHDRWGANTLRTLSIDIQLMNVRTHADQVGRQYMEDTSEVQEAKARFFKFFQFAVDGLLYK